MVGIRIFLPVSLGLQNIASARGSPIDFIFNLILAASVKIEL